MFAAIDEPLPGFRFLGENTDYAQLHRLLWRTPTSSPPAASAAREPPTLAEYIDVWTGGDNAEGGVDVMNLDENDSEPTPRPGPPQLRFIDLNKHPKLRVHSLLEPQPTVLVRGEYVEFMTHALQVEKDNERCFFLTGQPGISSRLSLFLWLALMHLGQARAWGHATSCFGCLHPASPYFSSQKQTWFTTSLRPASSKPQTDIPRETI
jgi:hypothetical protein